MQKSLREGSQSPNPSGHSKMVSREQHLARLVQQHSGAISVTWYMYQLNIITAIWKLPRPCPLQLVLHLTAYNTLTCQRESSVSSPELSLQLVQPQSIHIQHYPLQLVLHLPAANTCTYQTKSHLLYINTHYRLLGQVLHLTAHNTMTYHTKTQSVHIIPSTVVSLCVSPDCRQHVDSIKSSPTDTISDPALSLQVVLHLTAEKTLTMSKHPHATSKL